MQLASHIAVVAFKACVEGHADKHVLLSIAITLFGVRLQFETHSIPF